MVRSFFARLMSLWMRWGHFMGDLIARFALLFVFVLTVVPIHYIWSLLKKDPMKRSFQPQQKTYFEKSENLREGHWERLF